jgi:hypothetical protein
MKLIFKKFMEYLTGFRVKYINRELALKIKRNDSKLHLIQF